MGIFILVIALIAAFARSGSRTCEAQSTESAPPTAAPLEDYIATNGEKFPWRDIRLPSSIAPLEYDIYLHPNLTQRQFSGDVNIKCKVIEETKFIVLHSRDLVVSNFLVKILPDNEEKKITKHLEYVKNEQIYLDLESSIPAGNEILIKMHFEGKLIKKLSGFYLSSYEDSKNVTRFVKKWFLVHMRERKRERGGLKKQGWLGKSWNYMYAQKLQKLIFKKLDSIKTQFFNLFLKVQLFINTDIWIHCTCTVYIYAVIKLLPIKTECAHTTNIPLICSKYVP